MAEKKENLNKLRGKEKKNNELGSGCTKRETHKEGKMREEKTGKVEKAEN